MHWIDPACLPETQGTVTQFLLNPHGELDGFIVNGDRQVHFPPHLSAQIVAHIAVGDAVTVRGIRPRAAHMVAAVSIGIEGGEVILDEGPHHEGEAPEKPNIEPHPMEATGTVRLSLYGPKGELRGAMLDDGTSLRLPSHAATELQAYLTPGVHIQAWGHGVQNSYGRTLDVHEIAERVDVDTGA
jgi:hypothetical protein